MSSTVVVAVSVAAFLIGLSKGGLPGFGPSVTVIVALALPSTVALGVLLPLLMIGDVVALVALRGSIDRPVLGPVIGGAAIGVAGASFLLASLSPGAVEAGIVAIVVTFALYRGRALFGSGADAELDSDVNSRLAGPQAGAVAGVAAGITSTIAHAGGPPVAIHLLSRKLAPISYAATSAAIFWAVNWMKVPGYALAGLFDWDLVVGLAPTAVLIVPGVLVGRWAAQRINRRPFEIFVLAGMLVGAVLLVTL